MYIYIHIPFCSHICSYCDFPKVLYNKKYINNYLDSLYREIKMRYKGESVVSIFIGGGTPTSLDYDELKRLFDITKLFNKSDNLEFSIESNIESLDEDKIKLLKKYNVNRVSLGVQSFNDGCLKELNRYHNKDMVFDIVSLLKKNGIVNISIDLIYGVNSDINVLKEDMTNFLELDIPHVSCYSLIIENNTIFGNYDREYIDDEIEYEMYNYIEDVLSKNGYLHYEVSNYAKKGYESIHNLNYWDNGEYYGFGLGAVSYIDNYRISNTRNLTKYIDGNYELDRVYEDRDTRISNGLILGLRKTKGIKITEFNKKYDVELLDLYNIDELIKDEKLIVDGDYLYINPKYYYMSNEILVNFV